MWNDIFIFLESHNKRMAATEKIAGMDVLCSDKIGTLMLNKLTVDENLIEIVWQSKSLLFNWFLHASETVAIIFIVFCSDPLAICKRSG